MAQVMSYGTKMIRGQTGRQVFTAVDSAANDSDKTLTVPAGQVWDIDVLNITLATSADVGNRQITVVVSDGTNTLATLNAEANQAASLTEYYCYSPKYGTASEAPTGWHYIPLPPHILPAAATIRVYDSAAVAAAADDLTVVAYGTLL